MSLYDKSLISFFKYFLSIFFILTLWIIRQSKDWYIEQGNQFGLSINWCLLMLYFISQRCEWADIANAFLLSILFMYWLLRNKCRFYCLFLYWYWFPFFIYLYFLTLGLMSTNLIRIPSYVYKKYLLLLQVKYFVSFQ